MTRFRAPIAQYNLESLVTTYLSIFVNMSYWVCSKSNLTNFDQVYKKI